MITIVHLSLRLRYTKKTSMNLAFSNSTICNGKEGIDMTVFFYIKALLTLLQEVFHQVISGDQLDAHTSRMDIT